MLSDCLIADVIDTVEKPASNHLWWHLVKRISSLTARNLYLLIVSWDSYGLGYFQDL